jgi:hypothetical protein
MSPLAAASILLVAASACTQERPSMRLYAMGERAEAGSLVYNVLESAWKGQLGEGAHLRVPQNRFLVLRLSITNSGPNQISAPPTTLVSTSGTEYAELTNGEGVDEWLGVLRRLNATETIFGWVLFDAPRGDYQLRVSDDAFDPADARLAMIQIPLRLQSQSEYLPGTKANR